MEEKSQKYSDKFKKFINQVNTTWEFYLKTFGKNQDSIKLIILDPKDQKQR